MQVFCHHIYEYKKGVRNLILHTLEKSKMDIVESRLSREGIEYVIYSVDDKKINVFFGADECVDVIKKINKKSLVDYSPEEDFILGIMLGYDRKKQCERYLKMKVG